MVLFNLLAIAGALISLWGTGRYMLEIGRGHTQPRLASWIAWGTANAVLMAVALLNHNTMAAAFNGVAALGNVSVLLLSAWKRAGERPSGATDWTCLGASGLCLAAIAAFPHMWCMDAILAMSANVLATWPTIQHAWRRPNEEAWQLFAANSGANAFGLVGVIASGGMILCNIAGPLISMVGNLALVLITVGRSWATNIVHEVQEEVAEVEQAAAAEVAEVKNLALQAVREVSATASPAYQAPAAQRQRQSYRPRVQPSRIPLGSTASG
ncbi:MAG TPA: hypothetical protein VLF62_00060 [Candidatus Saccharimonadales bacterium]|nr:hypothetical protein [Candidatus Saccharimonadales bacterium]